MANNIERIVLTYGTFDLFHIGHLNLLRRASALGTKLFVGVSSDEFNSMKKKRAVISYADRAALVAAVRFVDVVFPEENWEQKCSDIRRFGASILVMGDDWEGKFDAFRDLCEVVYLDRTPAVSSSLIKDYLRLQGPTVRAAD